MKFASYCSLLHFPTVDDGAILDVVFENFNHGPPAGYDSIMVEKSLLEND